MTTYQWFWICEINNEKGNIRSIHIKCTTIVIVLYIIPENVSFVVQSHKSWNKMNINHLTYQFLLYNNQSPSVYCYEHLIQLPITQRFSKLGLLALNVVKNNRTIFVERSRIKIQSTLITLFGYNNGLMWFTWSQRFTTVFRSIPPQLSDPWHYFDVWCLLLICDGSCEFSNAGVDLNWK